MGGRIKRDSDSQLSWEYVSSDQVSLYDGSGWRLMGIDNLTLTVSSYDASSVYTIYLDYNDGTPQLTSEKWSGTTTGG